MGHRCVAALAGRRRRHPRHRRLARRDPAGRQPSPARPPRRLVITATVLAAFLVPSSFVPRSYLPPGVPAPPVLLLVAVGLPTILTILATAAFRPPATVHHRGPPGRYQPLSPCSWPQRRRLPPAQPDPFLTGEATVHLLDVMPPSVLAVPAAAWTITAIRGRSRSARRLALRLLLTPLLLLAGIAVTYAALIAAYTLARTVLFPLQDGHTGDDVAYLPAAVATGLLLGYLAATRLERPTPTPTPTTPTPAHPDDTRPGPALDQPATAGPG